MPPAPEGVPPPRSREHPIEVKTRIELVRLAYRELSTGTWVSAGVAVAFAVAVSTEFRSAVLWWWAGSMMVIAGYRLWLAQAFQRATPNADEYPRWGLLYVTGTTLTGLGWGASAWLLPTLHAGSALGIVHVLMMGGLITGSTRLLLPMRKGSLAYLFSMVVPLAARFFTQGDLVGVVAGIGAVLFMIYMVPAMLHNHQTLSDALTMRFEREAIAAELTAEIARRESREHELREARERAESASRAKGEFLATISHEIRTPMNGVLGMLRVMRDTPLSPEQLRYIKTASDSADALLLLLNDVLDFSKIEAGRLELEHAPFSPVPLVKAVSDLMIARARDKRLQFEVQLAENLPGVVVGDAPRLRQILVNLVGNAIKFTERGRVDLAVTCNERIANQVVLQFAVNDTGIGIDSAALERLFTPFSQADTSMSRRYGGTGLGLAISRRLAQAMGGTLQVQSALNQGSSFRLIIPFALPEPVTAVLRPESPQFVTPSLQGRVLVVEDDTVNQQVIDLFLKKMNLTPSFAANGESAIATATSENFDVVLMDCQLPGIDGLEATRQIRSKLAGKPLPIIALTANASTHVREACLAAGMNDFLSKPVRFELLATVMQKHLHAPHA